MKTFPCNLCHQLSTYVRSGLIAASLGAFSNLWIGELIYQSKLSETARGCRLNRTLVI
jgi:hypothetical protein